MLFAFFLGKIPAFSIAELNSVFKRYGAKFKPIQWDLEVLLVELNEGVDVMGLFHQLGGMIKVAVIVKNVKNVSQDDVVSLLPSSEQKVFFGISVYGQGIGKRKIEARHLGLGVKKLLRKEGKASRFVISREKTLSSVSVKMNKLLSERGAEIVIISTKDSAYLGKTIAVQDYESFSERDYGRPARDARSGMLPPKVARVMVNLSGVSSNQRLLDPFCGSGTILQEAVILGINNLVGTDIDSKAVEGTRKNFEWLEKNVLEVKSSFKLRLKQCDIRDLEKNVKKELIQFIVTEPYLGPVNYRGLERKGGLGKLRGVIDELTDLYRDSFNVFYKILAKKGRVVFVFPVWRRSGSSKVKNNLEFINVNNVIGDLGFKIVDPVPDELNPKPSPERGYLRERNSILYGREDQFVWREIRVFEKG